MNMCLQLAICNLQLWSTCEWGVHKRAGSRPVGRKKRPSLHAMRVTCLSIDENIVACVKYARCDWPIPFGKIPWMIVVECMLHEKHLCQVFCSHFGTILLWMIHRYLASLLWLNNLRDGIFSWCAEIGNNGSKYFFQDSWTEKSGSNFISSRAQKNPHGSFFWRWTWPLVIDRAKPRHMTFFCMAKNRSKRYPSWPFFHGDSTSRQQQSRFHAQSQQGTGGRNWHPLGENRWQK